MTDEEQQEQLRRLRDEHDTLASGLASPFWKILDRELAKREQLAFDALAGATASDLAMRAAGELVSIRSLRALPKSLVESYRSMLLRAQK